MRYAASALVDMAVHARTSSRAAPTSSRSSAPSSRASACRRRSASTTGWSHFQHLFSGSSYAAGYYVYLWAEVLDADGFDAFVEAGDPFDPAVARRLARFIYSSGNSIEPGAAYRAFRGRAADARADAAGSAACSSRSRASGAAHSPGACSALTARSVGAPGTAGSARR